MFSLRGAMEIQDRAELNVFLAQSPKKEKQAVTLRSLRVEGL